MEEWIDRTCEEQSFDGADFPASVLRQCTFTRCRFRGTRLRDLRTTLCRFDACDFTYALLNGSDHEDSSFANSLFDHTNLFAATLRRCQLLGANLSDADLRGLTIEGGDWSLANLGFQGLAKQDLRGLKLVEANLTGCDLRKADLRGAELKRAILREAKLAGADLRGADLQGIRLEELDLRGARIDSGQAILLARCHGAIVS